MLFNHKESSKLRSPVISALKIHLSFRTEPILLPGSPQPKAQYGRALGPGHFCPMGILLMSNLCPSTPPGLAKTLLELYCSLRLSILLSLLPRMGIPLQHISSLPNSVSVSSSYKTRLTRKPRLLVSGKNNLRLKVEENN